MKKIVLLLFVIAYIPLNQAIGQWTTTGDDIYNNNSGNVGIGNSTPSTLLYVAKIMTEPTITVRNLGGTGGATYSMVDNASGADWKFKAVQNGGFKIRDHANLMDVIIIEPNSFASAIYISSTDKVGIGTSAPIARLDVRESYDDEGVVIQLGTQDLSHRMLLFGGRLNDPNPFINWSAGDPMRFATNEGGWSEKMRITSSGQLAVGTEAPDNSALVDMTSTTGGLLIPRMTSAEISNIPNPADGLVVYCTTDGKFYAFVAIASIWKELLYGTGTISPPFICGTSIPVNHVAGPVAPVSKSVTYGTVNNIPGETSKCWITRNLGASQQASSPGDATEASAGWYWQFNRMQGYKHDGVSVTPAWTITSISENSDWLPNNDPCNLELGNGWRLPTASEWNNVDASGGWIGWAGPFGALNIHAAGYLNSADGSLASRGVVGYEWSSTQSSLTFGEALYFDEFYCAVNTKNKTYARTVRCVKD